MATQWDLRDIDEPFRPDRSSTARFEIGKNISKWIIPESVVAEPAKKFLANGYFFSGIYALSHDNSKVGGVLLFSLDQENERVRVHTALTFVDGRGQGMFNKFARAVIDIAEACGYNARGTKFVYSDVFDENLCKKFFIPTFAAELGNYTRARVVARSLLMQVKKAT